MTSQFITLELGIKKNQPDGLLIKLPHGSKSEMISTQNIFAAAPVVVSRKNIKSSKILYIFINSGNANACTGKKGMENTYKILAALAKKLGCSSHEILIMSTGIIGEQLPLDQYLNLFL